MNGPQSEHLVARGRERVCLLAYVIDEFVASSVAFIRFV